MTKKCERREGFGPGIHTHPSTFHASVPQDSGVVQDIKFGVSLVAGKKPNSTPNHRRAILAGLAGQVAGQDLVGGRGDARRARAALPGAAAAGEGVRPLPAIHVEVSRASAAAIEYVESSGGTVTCTHFNRLALRALVSGWVIFAEAGGEGMGCGGGLLQYRHTHFEQNSQKYWTKEVF